MDILIEVKYLLLKNKSLCIEAILDNKYSVDEFIDSCANKIKNSPSVLLFNSKHAGDNKAYQTGLKLRQLCSIYNSLLIVSSRFDLAELIHSDGVLLDKNDIPFDVFKKNHTYFGLAGYKITSKNEVIPEADFYLSKTPLKMSSCIFIQKLSSDNRFLTYYKE